MPCRHIFLLWVAVFAIPAVADPLESVRIALQRGDIGLAQTELDAARVLAPADAQVRLLEAELAWQQGQAEQALSMLEALQAERPDRPEPANNRAVILAKLGRLDEARVILEQALRQQPGVREAFDNLGDVYAQLAAQAYAKALATRADSTPSDFKFSRRLGPELQCVVLP